MRQNYLVLVIDEMLECKGKSLPRMSARCLHLPNFLANIRLHIYSKIISTTTGTMLPSIQLKY